MLSAVNSSTCDTASTITSASPDFGSSESNITVAIQSPLPSHDNFSVRAVRHAALVTPRSLRSCLFLNPFRLAASLHKKRGAALALAPKAYTISVDSCLTSWSQVAHELTIRKFRPLQAGIRWNAGP